MVAVAEVNHELDRIEVDPDRMVRFVAQKHFDWKNSCPDQIRFAELFFGACWFIIGVGEYGHSLMGIVRQGRRGL